jgi:hypothetical protein
MVGFEGLREVSRTRRNRNTAHVMSRSRKVEHSPPRPLGLEEVLRALPERELEALTRRLRIVVDHAKRIDGASQTARALVAMPELRDPGRMPDATRELLCRIAEAGGVLSLPLLPKAVEPLVARAVVFCRGSAEGVELVLPVAFLLQMKAWPGEDPRGIRALFSQTSTDVAASIAGYYLGRPVPPPVVLGLESAWLALTDPVRLQEEVLGLAPLERKLLLAIEEGGGEVDTEELLDLEREPMRLRGATGATPSRRGVGFALERRGFLIPVHPNRHLVPSEVSAVVSERHRAAREERRKEIRTFVLGEDHAPHRASFADDPVPLALAMALAVREPGVDVRSAVGTPRSLIAKLSTRFGRSGEVVALVAALSRAVGLWDGSAAQESSPPGSEQVGDIGAMLFTAWRRGGAWDEARPEGEVLRSGVEVREASAVGVIREMVLDALLELGEGRWVPWEAVAGFIRTDSRMPGLGRLLERWAGRSGIEAMTPADVAQRIALQTLHILGVVDLGDIDDDESPLGPTMRLTPRGRAYLGLQELSSGSRSHSRFLDTHALRIGPAARVADVISLAPFIEIGRVAGHLDVLLTQAMLSSALGAGMGPEVIRKRLSSLAQLPDPIDHLLAQASTVLGNAEYVASEGFLWVDDAEVRELLRTRRQTQELFVDPSPPGGLLLAPGVDLDRVARRCRGLGVEVSVNGDVYRMRSSAPPRPASAPPPAAARNPRASGTRRRHSTGTMQAVKIKRGR